MGFSGLRSRRASNGATTDPNLLRALAGVIVVVMTASFPVVLTGAMSVEMRDDVGFDNASLGTAVTSYYLVSALLSTSCGRFAERIGPRQTLRVAALLAALACIGIAAADRLAVLVVFLVVGGISVALAQPASNGIILERIPLRRRGLAFGIKQSSIPGGTALAGLAVPVIGLTVGWRWAFIGAAAMSLISIVAIPPSPPRLASRHVNHGVLRGSYRMLVVLAVAAALGAAPAMSLPVFLTASAVGRDFSTGAAGALLALGSIGGLAVRLLAGARADRRTGGHLRPIAALMSFGTIGLLGMMFRNPIVFTLATLLAFGAGWAWQGLFNHAVTNRWSTSPAAATGITQTGVFVGGIIGPLSFGWIASHTSDKFGWLVLAAMMAAGTTLVLSVKHWSSPTAAPTAGIGAS